jgi:hypothetical protein
MIQRLVRKSKVVLHKPKEDLTDKVDAAIRRVIASNGKTILCLSVCLCVMHN